jgi:carotenoid cleavage dioxygenase-like enzyme
VRNGIVPDGPTTRAVLPDGLAVRGEPHRNGVGRVRLPSLTPDAAEDEGVLTGYVYDRSTDRSELAILDAQTLQDIASIKLPHRVPAGFHSNWVPSDN